jgi:hypothetical protein
VLSVVVKGVLKGHNLKYMESDYGMDDSIRCKTSFPTWVWTSVDTKVNFSISQNTKFYAKSNFISVNFVKFVPIISRKFAEFR